MARPRTPTNVLELRGAFKRHPERKRDEEPKPSQAIGECPDRLDAGERAAWDEIVATCCPGVLTNADRLAVELAARLLAELWDTGREFSVARMTRLHSILGSLGMTPSDRSKVHITQPKPKSRYDSLGDPR